MVGESRGRAVSLGHHCAPLKLKPYWQHVPAVSFRILATGWSANNHGNHDGGRLQPLASFSYTMLLQASLARCQCRHLRTAGDNFVTELACSKAQLVAGEVRTRMGVVPLPLGRVLQVCFLHLSRLRHSASLSQA